MADDITLFRLNLYDSLAILPVQVLAPGTKIVGTAPYSNSLLSTLWVKSLDVGASVLVRYFDIGPGGGEYPGERIYLSEHIEISTADRSDRIIVPRLHNKAFAEIIVSGGNVQMGIYVTAVSTFPLDPPFKNGQNANLSLDGGNGNVVYSPSDNKFYLVTGLSNGAMNVNVTGGTIIEGNYVPLIFKGRTETTPNISQTLINTTVPTGKEFRIRSAKIITRCYGSFLIYANGDIIGEGLTSPAESNAKYDISPYWPVTEGKIIKVDFIQNYGPAMDVSAYLQVTAQDI
jgi:hypothetical protein